MLTELPWPAITAASGGWMLFALAGWLVFTGRLVPRSTLSDVTHDRDEWRAESRIKDAQIAEQNKQLGLMAEVGNTVEQLVRGLQQEMRQ